MARLGRDQLLQVRFVHVCIYLYCSCLLQGVHHCLRKLLPTGTTEHPPFIMESAPNCCQLTFSRLTAPLTETATGNKIDRDRSAKFIELHGTSSVFMSATLVPMMWVCYTKQKTAIRGSFVSGGQQTAATAIRHPKDKRIIAYEPHCSRCGKKAYTYQCMYVKNTITYFFLKC